ncbi:MAG: hypothetical protein HGN29_01170 [Asgard group archaeon]|nr:hypothetical protein [Asgard group archaeon]
MNRKNLIITTAVTAAIIVSFSVGLPLYFHYSNIYYPPVTIISYELNPTAGEEWTLNVSARTSGCYRMKTPVVEISEKQEYTVLITIKSKLLRRVICPGIFYHMNYLFQIIFPLPGNWTVHCNDKTITIYVQEPCYC